MPPPCGQTGTPYLAQQNDCHHVIHACDADGINLAVSNRAALEQLLEDHGRRRLFAAGKIKGGIGEGLGQFHITEYIVAGDGFLDPLAPNGPVLLDVLLGPWPIPVIVGINYQLRSPARSVVTANGLNARHVLGGRSRPTFSLNASKPSPPALFGWWRGFLHRSSLASRRCNRPWGRAWPWRLRVGALRCGAFAGCDSFLAKLGIAKVAPVDAVGNKFQFQIYEQFPERLIEGFGPEIPHGICNGAAAFMPKHAVVQPAQLMMTRLVADRVATERRYSFEPRANHSAGRDRGCRGKSSLYLRGGEYHRHAL